LSPTDTYPQHVVTAVLVAHDGAPWLPHVIDALLGQTRPVQRVVAVDTGSRDRSGGTLAAKLGQSVVFGMDRNTGYGAAVARALQHKAANVAVPGPPSPGSGRGQSAGRTDRVEWVWLLHDDCEPAPDALEQLLRGAAETPKAAVLGPKVMDWSDRDVILEAGLTIDTVGRRITGVEPREVDQGQHDGDRDSLAVGSPGMLVRRDVWEAVRGFDPSMGLFRDDIDFCWRVHAAGYRVRVITDAVVYHAQAASRRRRAVSVGRRQQLLDRRNALMTLAANLPLRPMLGSLASNIGVSFLRVLFFLLAKRVTAALDESAAVASVLMHPLRLMRARQLRARGRKAAYGRLRTELPPGRSIRRIAEFIAAMAGSAQQDTTGSHHATEDPDEADDFLLTDSGLAQRILTNPAVLLFIGLAIVTGVAERSLLSAGTLGGGSLLPAGGAAGLWHQYLEGFHPTGVGSPSVAPPYLAIMAILATLLLGKAWLAVDVVLLGCVPIAGMTAYLAVRRVTSSVPVRIWAAATYALVPVASGAVAAGRLGTCAAFALIPLIGLMAGRMLSQPPRIARRAAWATGLLTAIAAAFAPLVWPIVLAGVVAATLLLRRHAAALINTAIAAVVPVILLVPWSLQLASHPSALLLEAGVQQPGLASPDVPARTLMLLSPGGPGLPPVWVTGGLIAAALVALLAAGRRTLVLSGWAVAVLGLLVALPVSRLSVRPASGGPAVTAWPGVALAIAAMGLLVAAAASGDALGPALAGGRSRLSGLASGRGALVALVALVACTAPVAAAGFWVLKGVSGPIGPVTPQVLPSLGSVSAATDSQARTLVLQSSGSQVTYQLLRGTGLTLGDADVTQVPAAASALRTAVAALTAPDGGQAVDQARMLARFDVEFVLMRAPVDPTLARALDNISGLRTVSKTEKFYLWRLATPPSRVSVVEPDGTVAALPSGQVGVASARAPAAGGTLLLAEPAGGWKATLNGHPLTAVASPSGSWAQAFRLPSGGGTISLRHSDLGHDIGLAVELLAALVVAALALPGIRTASEMQAGAASKAAEAAGRGGEAEAAGRGGEADAEDAADSAAASGTAGGRRSRGRTAAGQGADSRDAAAETPGTPVPARAGAAYAAGDYGDAAYSGGSYSGDGYPGGERQDDGHGGAYPDDRYHDDEYAGAAARGAYGGAAMPDGEDARMGGGSPAAAAAGGARAAGRSAEVSEGGRGSRGGRGGKSRGRGRAPGRRKRPGRGDAAVADPQLTQPAAGGDIPAGQAGPRGPWPVAPARDWADSGPMDLPADQTAVLGGRPPEGRSPGGGPPGAPVPGGPPRPDPGVRSPTGAWPYPDDADLDDAGPPAPPRRPQQPGPADRVSGPYPMRSQPGAPSGGWQSPGQPGPGYDTRYGSGYGPPEDRWPEQDDPGRRDQGRQEGGRGGRRDGDSGQHAGPGRSGQPRREPGWEDAARWEEAQRQQRRPAGPPQGGRPQQPASWSSDQGPGSSPSWQSGDDPGAWPSAGQSSWSTGGQAPSWSGGDGRQDRNAGAPGQWRGDASSARPAGGPRLPSGHPSGPHPAGPRPGGGYPADARPSGSYPAGRRAAGQQSPGGGYGGPPGWPDEELQQDWGGPGDSLEPLPSADRARPRRPAPDGDDRDERDGW
jgi:GT2 family glycosyltransferase